MNNGQESIIHDFQKDQFLVGTCNGKLMNGNNICLLSALIYLSWYEVTKVTSSNNNYIVYSS